MDKKTVVDLSGTSNQRAREISTGRGPGVERVDPVLERMRPRVGTVMEGWDQWWKGLDQCCKEWNQWQKG